MRDCRKLLTINTSSVPSYVPQNQKQTSRKRKERGSARLQPTSSRRTRSGEELCQRTKSVSKGGWDGKQTARELPMPDVMRL
jgi:hypothetical protein